MKMLMRGRATFVGVAIVLGLARWAAARSVETPPWIQNPTSFPWAGGGVTHVQWEFTQDPTVPQFTHSYTTAQQPNIGMPTGATYPDVVTGPTGETIPTWHFAQDGFISLFIPNDPEPRLFKDILLQITSDKGQPSVPTANGVPGSPGGIYGFPGGSAWYTYTYTFHLEPNPNSETILIPVIPSTNVEEIVVDTICYNPEPASLTLLVGVMFVLRARRR